MPHERLPHTIQTEADCAFAMSFQFKIINAKKCIFNSSLYIRQKEVPRPIGINK
jgi:hypothetical protein